MHKSPRQQCSHDVNLLFLARSLLPSIPVEPNSVVFFVGKSVVGAVVGKAVVVGKSVVGAVVVGKAVVGGVVGKRVVGVDVGICGFDEYV